MAGGANAAVVPPGPDAGRPWRRDGDEVVLIGLQCRRCAQRYFPSATWCSGCRGRDFDPVELGGGGTLYSFTEVHVAPGAFAVPYVVGYVDLDAGVRVFAQIDGPLADLRLDARMRAVLGPIRTDPDGRPVEGYRFRVEEGR